MSLARALTKRIGKRHDEPTSPRGRAFAGRHGVGPIDVSMISSPITLLSTTNVHALNAPDIRKASGESASSAASTHSGNESEFSTIDRSFLSSNEESSPGTPGTPITPPTETTKAFFDVVKSEPEVPTLPQRSPSHSKKAHIDLSRKLSIQRNSPPPTSLTRAASVRDTTMMFTTGVQDQARLGPESHPFGAELAKVNEVAEGFGAVHAVLDEEEQLMLSKGLKKFGVQDYLDEIQGLYGGVFEDQLGSIANPWI